ncbi:LysE family translocator [Maritimibacter sp. HL-12]|uniref:LysE family translocator n=1 Tax=Maritimibacter sp. HL-12 TaxID=1162418 RepID=UPI000A0F0C9F|nr:LysE family translocator [Maritimibacter sp. HL-12]SMH51733.1 Threonine/homoserine/homoserine lactone efflux protein [Maritimibacter sp. HL-12]
MTPELFLAFATFAFVSSATPGPNNMMLLASGANFGMRRTVPHMLGVGIGFSVMILGLGLGLVALFERFPVAYDVLKGIAVIYMLWLAWKIAHASAPDSARAGGKPFTFFQAAGFQWVNPKAWAMALTALTAYAPGQTLAAVGLVALIFGAINLPTVAVWALLGREMRRFLTNPRRLTVFNWTMAAALLASLWPVLFA